MNHGKQDTGTTGQGKFTRQKDAPSRLEREAERERPSAANTASRQPASSSADAADRSNHEPGTASAGNDVHGAGQQASNIRGTASAGSPRASATDSRHSASTDMDDIPGAMPAKIGDRNERERQVSEPGAAYTDSERQPQTALRDVEGTSDESDLSTRDEGGSRRADDVATSGLAEQQQRMQLPRDRDSRRQRESHQRHRD